MLQKTSHFLREANLINGEWVQADSGATIDVINPATVLKIGTVPKSGKAETRRAIEAADAAFQTWRKTSALERSRLLRALHDAITDNQQPLAELLTTEQGKSLAESIRCNSIHPGTISTPMTAEYEADPNKHEMLVGVTVLGRIGRPREASEVVVFLLSEAASYMTGSEMTVDGGFTSV